MQLRLAQLRYCLTILEEAEERQVEQDRRCFRVQPAQAPAELRAAYDALKAKHEPYESSASSPIKSASSKASTKRRTRKSRT